MPWLVLPQKIKIPLKDGLNVSFLPYGKQVIDEEDIEAVVAVLRSDWLTTGPQVESFENDFANECNAAHAISCGATTGLQMAAKVLDLGPVNQLSFPVSHS